MARQMPDSEISKFTLPMMRRDDLDEARAALRRYPRLVTNPVNAAYLMHNAAQAGKTRFVALLHEFGVDVNIPDSPDLPDRPISSAAMQGRVDTVRWLIEHGSDINYGWDGEPPFCHPMPAAIRDQNFEIVKLLVEAGADLLAKDRNNMTPLDWAHGMELTDIANYLRSKGGKLSSDLPGQVAPASVPEPHIIVQYASTALGFAAPVPFPGTPGAVRLALYGYGSDTRCNLFTLGMSDQPMTVPPGGDGYQYAELVVGFDVEHWPLDNDWTRPEYRWLPDWMHRIAQTPFETGTWLGGKFGIISNGEPPQPLSASTSMTCWLLLAEKGPLVRLDLNDGRSVVFYTMLPIYTEERDFVLKEGVVPLLQKFAEQNVSDGLEPNRPSVLSSAPPVRPRGK